MEAIKYRQRVVIYVNERADGTFDWELSGNTDKQITTSAQFNRGGLPFSSSATAVRSASNAAHQLLWIERGVSDMMTPEITDNDRGTITATIDLKVVRSWEYNKDVRRSRAMSLAKEYAEGWRACAVGLLPALQVARAVLSSPKSTEQTEALAVIAKALGSGAWDGTDGGPG